MLGTMLLACAACAAPLELHVAVDGRDDWSGRLARPNAARTDGPFASLERARDELRQRRPAEGATVHLGPGEFYRAATFDLEAHDSGTAAAPIVYRGAGPATRLLGGRLLPADAWGPVTDPALLARLEPAARPRIRALSLAEAGIAEPGPDWFERFRERTGWPELFFAGRRMPLARWPNEGWSRIVEVTGGEPFDVRGTVGDKRGRFTYEGERPARWRAEPELWLHGFWFWDWSDQRQRVQAIDPATSTIELAPPAHHYGYRQRARWCAFNALGELDAPGEWCVDRASWTLFFLPPEPLEAHEAALTLLAEPIVSMVGASHVTVRDLTIELARGDGLRMVGGEGNLVAGCTFRNLGRLGLSVDGGRGHRVQSCDLYHLGAGGINVDGGDRATLTPCEHVVENCQIHHFAELAFTYQNAIRLNGVGCTARHNLIHDTIHEALCYAGNDHVVELNEVYRVCLEADDSGVLHQGRDWTWRGNIVRWNYFHDIPAGNAVNNMGVYLDDMECGTLVEGNVLVRIPRAVLIGGGRDNRVRGNLIVDCPISVHLDNRAMNWAGYHVGTTMKERLDAVPYQSEVWRTRYPALLRIWDDEPAVPKGNEIRGNLMVRSGPFALAPEVTRFGTVADNAFVADDPGFANAAADDWRLPAGVGPPGFEPPPFERMGLVVDAFRPRLPLREPVLGPRGGVFIEELEVRLSPGRGLPPDALRYTLDGSEPTAESPLYRAPLRLTETTSLRAAAFAAGQPRSAIVSAHFEVRRLGPGGGVSLSELPALEAVAYAGLKRDTSYAGDGPVVLGGVTYARSLMVHPDERPGGGRGQVEFALTGGLARARAFSATIGVEDAMRPNGSVVFVVELRRAGQWREVFRSGVLRGGEAQPIEIDVAGAEALRLITLDGGDHIHSDHAVWAEPLLR